MHLVACLVDIPSIEHNDVGSTLANMSHAAGVRWRLLAVHLGFEELSVQRRPHESALGHLRLLIGQEI